MGKRILIVAFVLILTVLNVSVSVGQCGSFTLVNDSDVTIDYEAVRDAAAPLISGYGARVAIYAVVSGDSADFTSRLQADGLATRSGTNPDTFAIYIATEEQYSEVRWGADFDGLDGDAVRSDHLNPMLRERNFTQAFVDALDGASSQLSNPLYGLTQFLKDILGIPEVWIVIGILALLFILHKAGILKSSGAASSDSWSSSSHNSGSSWSSSDSSSSDSGGSSGGSWDD